MRRALPILFLAPLLASCSSTDPVVPDPPDPPGPTCKLADAVFEAGDPVGHADPLGAAAAKQARAGRIGDASMVPQPAHGRQRIEAGDYLIINDKIAVVIEDKGLSDGYARFGGEILSVDRVGEGGKPMGLSLYGETLMGVGIRMINPTSVTVLHDGSDGGEAVVRVTGPIQPIPFLNGPISALFPRDYELQMAYDYVLTPGAEAIIIRVGVINPGLTPINFYEEGQGSDELFGFFQHSRSQIVTPESGFGKPTEASSAWVGFDGGPSGFAFRTRGAPLLFGTEQSGFDLFWGQGFVVDACARTTKDRVEIIVGGPEYDGLREAIRRTSGEPAWRAVTGTLVDGKGLAVADAWVHGLDDKGLYLTRTRTDEKGAFVVHAPPGAPISLIPQKLGYPSPAAVVVDKGSTTAALTLGATATLHVVTAGDATKAPVRIQVIPTKPEPGTPEGFGFDDEVDGRLHQNFALAGEATLTVPPGEHRIIVSRGYEWELFDTTVTVAAGETKEISAPLAHSVDTTGAMCADFHIHSMFSADSSDSVSHKVAGAVADGLDIPVSSEHEWVTDFQPVIKSLGVAPWAFGMASSELTTFAWGHFGVVPLTPHDGVLNHGAVEWIGRTPAEVFKHVHELPEKPILIVNHPRGSGFGGYFSAAAYDGVKDTGDPELWSNDFDAIEVFNDSDFEKNRNDSVADWFALMNHGHKVSATGSSDSHHLRTSPVGYPRTCFQLGHDDPTKLTPKAVRDAVAGADSTISGGLFMTVAGPGGERPGATVMTAGGSATFLVTVQAPSWIAANTLETIVNGKTVAMEPLLPIGAGPAKKFANQVTVKLDPGAAHNWVVFHAKGETDLAPLHPGRRPFAVSNPVFLK